MTNCGGHVAKHMEEGAEPDQHDSIIRVFHFLQALWLAPSRRNMGHINHFVSALSQGLAQNQPGPKRKRGKLIVQAAVHNFSGASIASHGLTQLACSSYLGPFHKNVDR